MLNILLVEDEPAIGNGIKTLLEMQGEGQRFCVTWLERGDTAIEQLSKPHDFHCILIDLSLYGAPGIEVIEHLRQWDDKKTPVIVTTARRRIEVWAGCVIAGANDMIEKPFEYRDLIAMIEKYCK